MPARSSLPWVCLGISVASLLALATVGGGLTTIQGMWDLGAMSGVPLLGIWLSSRLRSSVRVEIGMFCALLPVAYVLAYGPRMVAPLPTLLGAQTSWAATQVLGLVALGGLLGSLRAPQGPAGRALAGLLLARPLWLLVVWMTARPGLLPAAGQGQGMSLLMALVAAVGSGLVALAIWRGLVAASARSSWVAGALALEWGAIGACAASGASRGEAAGVAALFVLVWLSGPLLAGIAAGNALVEDQGSEPAPELTRREADRRRIALAAELALLPMLGLAIVLLFAGWRNLGPLTVIGLLPVCALLMTAIKGPSSVPGVALLTTSILAMGAALLALASDYDGMDGPASTMFGWAAAPFVGSLIAAQLLCWRGYRLPRLAVLFGCAGVALWLVVAIGSWSSNELDYLGLPGNSWGRRRLGYLALLYFAWLAGLAWCLLLGGSLLFPEREPRRLARWGLLSWGGLALLGLGWPLAYFLSRQAQDGLGYLFVALIVGLPTYGAALLGVLSLGIDSLERDDAAAPA